MTRRKLVNKYFNWLISIIDDRDHDVGNYISLLSCLFENDFWWIYDRDENRATDGVDLRRRFVDEKRVTPDEAYLYLNGTCNVLEMIVALACRMEDSAMTDMHHGDRTGEWFWLMMHNLGLDGMDDDHFDQYLTEEKLHIFMDRKYSSDGSGGGLFVISDTHKDLRTAEIWCQMNWYVAERFL